MGRNESDYRKELKAEYKKLQSKANWRLRELEKISNQPEYEHVLDYAYRVAMRDIAQFTTAKGSGTRFTIPKNTHQLEKALKSVKKFLAADTSTKTGVINVYMENANNFNTKFGTNYTWAELKNFTDTVNWDQLKKDYGSPLLVKVIASLNKKADELSSDDKDELIKEIDESLARHKQVLDDEVENEIAIKLAKSGVTLELLQSGSSQDDIDNPFI